MILANWVLRKTRHMRPMDLESVTPGLVQWIENCIFSCFYPLGWRLNVNSILESLSGSQKTNQSRKSWIHDCNLPCNNKGIPRLDNRYQQHCGLLLGLIYLSDSLTWMNEWMMRTMAMTKTNGTGVHCSGHGQSWLWGRGVHWQGGCLLLCGKGASRSTTKVQGAMLWLLCSVHL